MPQEPKKPWTEPELIVIVRGKPEEAVLTACKGGSQNILPNMSNVLCQGLYCGEMCSGGGAS